MDSAYRSTVTTAAKVADQVAGKDGGILAKARAVDLGQAVRDAKVQTKQAISDKFREVDINPTPAFRQACTWCSRP